MPPINESKDFLYIAISLAVLFFTIFSCWAIYYLAKILQQSFQIVKEMRDRLHKVDTVIDSLKEKINHSASYLMLIGEGIKTLVEVMRNRGEKKRKAKKAEQK